MPAETRASHAEAVATAGIAALEVIDIFSRTGAAFWVTFGGGPFGGGGAQLAKDSKQSVGGGGVGVRGRAGMAFVCGNMCVR